MIPETKYCKGCNRIKPAFDFYLPPSRGYLSHLCKECNNSKTSIVWRHKHPEKHAAKQKRYSKGWRGVYRRLKSSALQRDIQLSISFEEFIQWRNEQPLVCYYCGGLLHIGGCEKDCLTIDRINNQSGYALGNIVLACLSCNSKKGNHEKELKHQLL